MQPVAVVQYNAIRFLRRARINLFAIRVAFAFGFIPPVLFDFIARSLSETRPDSETLNCRERRIISRLGDRYDDLMPSRISKHALRCTDDAFMRLTFRVQNTHVLYNMHMYVKCENRSGSLPNRYTRMLSLMQLVFVWNHIHNCLVLYC